MLSKATPSRIESPWPRLVTDLIHPRPRRLLVRSGPISTVVPHAGLVARYQIEELAGLPCMVDIASEYRSRRPVVRANTLFVGSDGMLLCGFGMRKLLPESKFAGTKAPGGMSTSTLSEHVSGSAGLLPHFVYFDGTRGYPGGGDYYDRPVEEYLAAGEFSENRFWLMGDGLAGQRRP